MFVACLRRPTYMVSRLLDGIRGAYSDLNPSTLTGAIDVVVVRQEDGSFKCGPFHVRFGKMGALRPADLLVDIYVNGEYVEDLHMRLGPAGEAFFVEEAEEEELNNSVPSGQLNPGDPRRVLSVSNLPDLTTNSNIQVSNFTNNAPKTPLKRSHSLEKMDLLTDESSPSVSSTKQRTVSTSFDHEGPHSHQLESHLNERKVSCPIVPCFSDSALHLTEESQSRTQLQWDWGDFPTDTTTPMVSMDTTTEPEGPLRISFDAVHNLPAPETRQSPAKCAPQNEKNGGILLEDLIASRMDENVKSTYLYSCQIDNNPALSSSSCSFPSNSNLVRFNSLESLNPQHKHDAGYRSAGGEFSLSPQLSHTPPYPTVQRLKFSLCGGLSQEQQPSEEQFYKHLVTYEDFIKDPEGILADPQLVVLFNDAFLPWPVVAPMLISVVAFQTELTHSVRKRLEETHLPKSHSKRRKPWFYWGSTTNTETLVTSASPQSSTEIADKNGKGNPEPSSNSNNVPPSDNLKTSTEAHRDTVEKAELSGPAPTSTEASLVNPEDEQVAYRLVEDTNPASDAPPTLVKYTKAFKKVNRLSGEKLRKLNLREGYNEVEYRVITRWQGTARCKAAIFLWNWYDRLVISDVDGTITRSDVLGNVFPLLGRDWTQLGVIKLYNKIAHNGYRFVYLSSRAIGQSEFTRRFLTQLVQENNLQLPKGPILLSPNSLLHAFHLEVIERRPDIFKIQCMKDLQLLFPEHVNPFTAGFGNRPTDVKTYQALGIPESHIFTVDYTGLICSEKVNLRKTSYSQLTELVDYCFPALAEGAPSPRGVQVRDSDVDMLHYSTFTYFNEQLPSVEDVLASNDFVKPQNPQPQEARKKRLLSR